MSRHFLLFAAIVIALTSSCSALKNMTGCPDVTAELTDSLAVREDGSLPINCKVTVPAEYRKIHTSVLIYPSVVAADSSEVILFDNCAIDGKFNETFNDRMTIYQESLSDSISVRYSYAPKGEATEIMISDTLSYQQWMNDASLEVDFKGESYGETTPLGHASIPLFIKLPEPEPEPEEPVYEECSDSLSLGYTRFRIGSYDVDTLAAEVSARIREILTDSTVVSVRTVVTGSCSPEGPEDFNAELAQNRADAVASLLREEGLENVEVVPAGVNWDMLYEWLAEKGNQSIVDRIRKIDDPVKRYQDYRDNSYEVWRQSRGTVFRAMRCTQVEILYTKKTIKQE